MKYSDTIALLILTAIFLKIMHTKALGWTQMYRTMNIEIFCDLEPQLYNKLLNL